MASILFSKSTYIQESLKVPFWGYLVMFCILVLSLLVFYPSIQNLAWSPPSKLELTEAQGHFKKTNRVTSSGSYGSYHPTESYIFVANTGIEIGINCEPYPALNICLEDQKLNSALFDDHSDYLVIIYYKSSVNQKTYNTLYEISIPTANKKIFSYDEAVKRIKNTSVMMTINSGMVRTNGVIVVYFILALFTFISCVFLLVPLTIKLIFAIGGN
jgi:hypothetical protein